MDINGVKHFKYTSISNVQRKLTKNNADDGSRGDDNFDTVNSNLRKKRSIGLIMPENASEGAPKNTLPKIPQIFSDQNTNVLSDQKEDSWKRAMLFMDQK
jgi:hypothetical protein